jgi:hypothetical protein
LLRPEQHIGDRESIKQAGGVFSIIYKMLDIVSSRCSGPERAKLAIMNASSTAGASYRLGMTISSCDGSTLVVR